MLQSDYSATARRPVSRNTFTLATSTESRSVASTARDSAGRVRPFLGMMERDPYVFDIRWMAYLLATASIETGWLFKPVDEKGHGKLGKVKKGPDKGKWKIKDYYLPVKVKLLKDGTASVTEQDGDEFVVRADGSAYDPVGSGHRGAKAIDAKTNAFTQPTAVYTREGGVERSYYGRGFCQLTWWDNYASAGWVLGRNLDFLFDPDLVLEPEIAYEIMAVGMRTGTIFANGMKISRFICGNHCDYLHARQMVNGMSEARKIADIAVEFEGALLASKGALYAAAL